MSKSVEKTAIDQVIALLQSYSSADKRDDQLRKKMERLQIAIKKENAEKVFWQRLCRYYAPNRMQEHYDALDRELEVAGLRRTPVEIQNEQNGTTISTENNEK